MEKQEPTVEDLQAKITGLEEAMAVQSIVCARFQQLYANEVATSANLGARLQIQLGRLSEAAPGE